LYVHNASGLCYLANPRTASRATAKALVEQARFRMVGSHHSYDEGPWAYTTFSTVRGLVSTIASWAGKLDCSPNSALVALDANTGNQRGIINGWENWTLFPHARRSDVLLHYENLELELNDLLKKHGLAPVRLEG
jgi:hypothetical protein